MSDWDAYSERLDAEKLRNRAHYCANKAYKDYAEDTEFRNMLANLSQTFLLLAQDAERQEFSL